MHLPECWKVKNLIDFWFCPRDKWPDCGYGWREIRFCRLKGWSTLSVHQQLPTCQNLTGISTFTLPQMQSHHTQKQKNKPITRHKSHLCFIKVTWQKLVNGSKQNVAIANPSLGVSVAPPYRDRVTFKNGAVRRRTPNLEDTTISFSSLRLSDEATYICEYTTFPAGNRENTVNLTVYGKVDNYTQNYRRNSL